MTRDISKYVSQCEICQNCKQKSYTKEPMQITDIPQDVFDIVSIDTVTANTKSINGNQYIVTIICDLSKYLIAVPIPDKSARSIAKAIYEHFILVYGAMKILKSDNGTEYKNQLIDEFCKVFNVNQVFSVPYRHQTMGTVERCHRTMNEYLRSYVNDYESEWEDYLRQFVFCYNCAKHSSFDNKYSPFEVAFTRNPNMPNDLLNGRIDPIYNVDNFVKEAKYRFQLINEDAKKLLLKSKQRNKVQYDKSAKPSNIKIGDRVKLKMEPYNKFRDIYEGPYSVGEVESNNALIYNEKRTKRVHLDQLKKINTLLNDSD